MVLITISMQCKPGRVPKPPYKIVYKRVHNTQIAMSAMVGVALVKNKLHAK